MLNLKHFISLTTLAGALATAGVAQADGWRGHHHRNVDDQQQQSYDDQSYDDGYRSNLDIIGTKTLRPGRGVATFTVTPGVRRDGLELRTGASGLRILAVDFVYSDGRIVRLPGQNLRTQRDGLLTIQTGRPPGLRQVRVSYRAPTYQRSGYDSRYDNGYVAQPAATLQLVQLHTGDGYTHTDDLWQNRDPDGDGDDEVDGGYNVDR